MKIKNPIISAELGNIRDPMIFYHDIDDKYYMVATSPEFWVGNNPGVKLWSSANLIDWTFEKTIIDSSKIPESKSYRSRFWAPEILYYNNRYYCTFNCHSDINKNTYEDMQSYVAVADNILGPYKIYDKPLFHIPSNDAHLFADDDGKVYVFLTTNECIYMLNFDSENCCSYGEAIPVVKIGIEGEWDNIGVEGSFVIKRNGLYYHWYSSWTRTYEMGLAVTDSLDKPFEKIEINPVISGYGTETPMEFCGHNSCFKLRDGRDAIAFHSNGKNFSESLCIMPVEYPFLRSYEPAEFFEI